MLEKEGGTSSGPSSAARQSPSVRAASRASPGARCPRRPWRRPEPWNASLARSTPPARHTTPLVCHCLARAVPRGAVPSSRAVTTLAVHCSCSVHCKRQPSSQNCSAAEQDGRGLFFFLARGQGTRCSGRRRPSSCPCSSCSRSRTALRPRRNGMRHVPEHFREHSRTGKKTRAKGSSPLPDLLFHAETGCVGRTRRSMLQGTALRLLEGRMETRANASPRGSWGHLPLPDLAGQRAVALGDLAAGRHHLQPGVDFDALPRMAVQLVQ